MVALAAQLAATEKAYRLSRNVSRMAWKRGGGETPVDKAARLSHSAADHKKVHTDVAAAQVARNPEQYTQPFKASATGHQAAQRKYRLTSKMERAAALVVVLTAGINDRVRHAGWTATFVESEGRWCFKNGDVEQMAAPSLNRYSAVWIRVEGGAEGDCRNAWQS